ncbi:hypothetical protein U1701_17360 [Sphingomonas sp. PB2P19]|uniref:hypothetical protein n=1 Tax=Sphingomonas rhamnosi TaxID=3096156 RepID=UPI002FC7F541
MGDARDFYAEAQGQAQSRRLGPLRLAKLAALQVALLERGVPSDDLRLPFYFAPLLGTAPDDADDADYCGPLTATAQTKSFPLEGQDADAPGTWRRLGAAARSRSLALRSWFTWDRARALLRSERFRIYAGLTVLALLLILIFGPSNPLNPDAIDTSSPLPPIFDAATRSRTGSITQSLFLLNGTVLLADLALAALAFAWPYCAAVLHERRRTRLRESVAAIPHTLIATSVRLAQARFFDDPSFAASLRKLRRYTSVPSNSIDVAGSIRATIAHGTEPQLRFARRKRSPDYVLLSEREQPGDHLPELAKSWREHLGEAQISCAHYEFFGDPHTLRALSESQGRLAAPADQHERLEDVLLRHPGAHVVIMLESFDALPDGASLPRWLQGDRNETRFHLMNPRAARHWAAEEVRLAGLNVESFDATCEGSLDFADQVDRASGEGEVAPPDAPGEADLGGWLAAHRSLLLAQAPPTEHQVQVILDTLQRWLDREAFDWLRALAVMPVISPGYTLFCGAVLADQTLVTHDRFLALARLPWLRSCTMPAWLRLALLGSLSPAALERAAAVAAAFLDPTDGEPQTAEDLVARRRTAEDAAQRAALSQRLRQSRHPIFNDPLLHEALQGEVPQGEPLDVRAHGMVPVSRPRWFRRPGYQASIAAGLAIVLLLFVQPQSWREQGLIPFGSRQVPQPPASAPAPEPMSAAPSPLPTPDTPPPASESAADAMEAAADAASAAAAKAAIEADAPAPDQALRGRSSTLYIQIADENQRRQAQAVQARLAGAVIAGVTVTAPGVQNTATRSPNSTQLRCFTASACAFAQYLVPVISSSGVDARIVRFTRQDFTTPDNRLQENQVELWLGQPANAPNSDSLGKTPTSNTPKSKVPASKARAGKSASDASGSTGGGWSVAQDKAPTQVAPSRTDQSPVQAAPPAATGASSSAAETPSSWGMTATAYFSYDNSALDAEAVSLLTDAVRRARSMGSYRVRLDAYTDLKGGSTSAARDAQVVRAYLVGLGVPEGAIATTIHPTDRTTGSQQTGATGARRVEATFLQNTAR